MTITATEGPEIAWGQNPPVAAGAAPGSYNADRGPSLFDMGVGLIDPQFGYKNGGGGSGASSPQGSPLVFGYAPGMNQVVLDQVPSAAAANNIAAAANVTNGTPMTLVSSTGAGITVMTSPLFIQPAGLTVPACLAIDGLPGWVPFGQTGKVQVWDPTKILARAVSITGVAGGSGGHFLVSGYDYRGNPQTENINATSGATTTNGKKAFKFVASVTPLFTDAHNYSVGTADVYGLPLRADVYGYVYACFNNAPVTSPSFVAADTTSPATSTTGDVRGTISVTSDGTKRLQVMEGASPANLASLTPNSYVGLFGVTPA